jgi:hypothetical protein
MIMILNFARNSFGERDWFGVVKPGFQHVRGWWKPGFTTLGRGGKRRERAPEGLGGTRGTM